MEQLRLFTIVTASISIVISIFENILPSEKYQKQLRLLFGTVMLICIIKPIATEDFSLSEIENEIEVYKNYPEIKSAETDEYLKTSIENNISREIGLILSESKISYENIKTSINISENFSISITKVEITSNQNSKDETIAKILTENLGDVEYEIIRSENIHED